VDYADCAVDCWFGLDASDLFDLQGYRKGNGMNQAQRNTHFYLESLKSDKCFCGRSKKPGHSFCSKCFYSLPGVMRIALYQLIGDGYELAYEEAVVWLT